MNAFPLTPFLTALSADDFHFTLNDYRRISIALRAEQTWNIDRLRTVLMALLVKDRERQDIFLRRFDQFFDSSSATEKRFACVDVQKALTDLKTLAEDKGRAPRWQPIRRFSAKSPSEEKPVKAKYVRLIVLIAELGLALALLAVHYFYFPITPQLTDKPIPVISPTPTPTPEPPKPPLTIKLEPVSPQDTWALTIYTGMAAVLLMLIGLYGFFNLWWSRRIPPETEIPSPVTAGTDGTPDRLASHSAINFRFAFCHTGIGFFAHRFQRAPG